MSATFRIHTLGCKLNQFDSAEVESALRGRGLLPAGSSTAASVVVVNTCTVTHRADADGRRLLRRARRENPGCLVVATGCLAERDPDGLERLADLVVRRRERERLPEMVAVQADAGARGVPAATGPSCAGAPAFGERSRAFLKVQEGCDLRCAYCIIPQVRGPSRSVPPEAVEARLQALIDAGYREVVLTGVNTGDYGRDLTPATDLACLLRRLLAVPGLGRLRLNSLEPRTVTPPIIDLLAGEEKLAPHLQVPLQSASDRVLRAMRRNYRLAHYQAVVSELRRRLPNMAIGADVIVGHPGEDEAAFERTWRFVAESPLDYLHVFSYSRREGTPAAELPGQVDPAAVRARSRRLRALGAERALRFRRSQVGRRVDVLVYQERRGDGRLRGLTGNFIEVGIDGPDELANRLLPATVIRADRSGALAQPAAPA